MADYTITITDQDAIDALTADIQRIADAGGPTWKDAAYLSDLVTTSLLQIRRGQVMAEAQKAAADVMKPFDDKMASKSAAAVDAVAALAEPIKA